MIRTLTIVLIIIFILAPMTSAMSLQREVEMEFKGKIDYHMVAGNEDAVTATKIQGEGTVAGSNLLTITEDNLNSDQSYLLIADDTETVTGRPYKNIEFTTVLRDENDQIYAIGLKVYGGENAKIDTQFDYDTEVAFDLSVDTYAEVTYGVYRRYIHLESDEITLAEVMEAVGQGKFKDQIRFKPSAEEAVEVITE